MAATAAQANKKAHSRPMLIKQTVDHAFRLSLELHLDFDITSFKRQSLTVSQMPLRGDWELRVGRAEVQGEASVELYIHHGALPVGCIGARVAVSWEFLAVGAVESWRIAHGTWVPEPVPADTETGPYTGFSAEVSQAKIDHARDQSGGAFDPVTHRHYCLRFEMRQAATRPTDEAKELAERIADLNLSPTPYDVRLFFPNACEGGAELWVESAFLEQSSSFFEALSSSGLAETVTISPSKKRPRLEAQTATTETSVGADIDDFVDSDEETDAVYFDARPHHAQAQEDDFSLTYKQITINKTAFTTYRAVLAFLRTGYIASAPLASTCQPRNSTSTRTREEQLLKLAENEPLFPVSPKSVYRLAHFLELEDLQELCLARLRKVLTVSSAPYELVDDACACFDEWREVVVDFVVQNWAQISTSTNWMDVKDKIMRGELTKSGPGLLEVLTRTTTVSG